MFFIKTWTLLVAICYTFGHVVCTQQEVLIVYDSTLHDLESLSSVSPKLNGMIEQLQGSQSFNLTFKKYDDEYLSLFLGTEPIYNHLVLLPSSKRQPAAKEGFSPHKILDFINQEGNILVVGGGAYTAPDNVRRVLNEIGIFPAPKGYAYVDHFNSDNGDVQIKDEQIVNSKVIEHLPKGGIVYKGTSALLSNNPLVFPIVKSTNTGFTADTLESAIKEENLWTAGEQGFLAAGFQSLHNSRLAWVGSESLICEDIWKWVFQEKNALKLQFVQHYAADHPHLPNKTLYKIKDQVFYTVGVSEKANGEWVPYVLKEDKDILQISFKMLDPYQRLNLKPLGPAEDENGDMNTFIYYANFTIPDHHGIFTFELDYKRPGLSYLVDKKVVTARHLANDEYKRSWDITNSWFYVTCSVLVVLAWFLFVVNFVFIGGGSNPSKKNV